MRSRPVVAVRSRLVFLMFGAVFTAACSAVVDADKAKLGAVPIPCEPGTTAVCPCRDGSTSTQVCNDRARYDRCACASIAGRGLAGASAGGVGGSSVRPTAGR